MPLMECTENGKPGFKYGQSGKCYTSDGTPEGIKSAKKKAIKQGVAMGEGKLEDGSGEPTIEYLTAFHSYVKTHPEVYDHIKSQIHLRARGSAGGKIAAANKKLALVDVSSDDDATVDSGVEGMEKSTNAAYPGEGEIVETDEYIDAPTVIAKEGVFVGTNGVPTKKDYDALKASAPRFLGLPLTASHIQTDTLRPTDRWLGHVVAVEPRDDRRDLFGTARYFKDALTDSELEKIRNRDYPDGSIGYFTVTEKTEGEFDGKVFSAVEKGPYVPVEYATFFDGTKGACSRSDGCGPFQNAAHDDPPKGDNMTEDISALILRVDDLAKKLNEAAEKNDRLEAEIGELKQKNEAQEAETKKLNEAFEAKKTAEAEAKVAADRALFVKQLNAAAAADPAEVEKMFNAYTADPVGWLAENRKKLLVEVDPKKADGKQFNAGGQDPYEAAKAKTEEILFKRR